MPRHVAIDYPDAEVYEDRRTGRRPGYRGPSGYHLTPTYYGECEADRSHKRSLLETERCIYCESSLTGVRGLSVPRTVVRLEPNAGYLGGTESLEESLRVCDACGWWYFHGFTEDYVRGGEGSEGRDFTLHELLVSGKAKTFDDSSPDAPLAELRSWLARHPNHMAHIHPYTFERVLADSFRDLYPEAEVHHVGKTGDGGVDIKLVLRDSGPILVQVKRREDLGSTEGVKTVRELNGVLLREATPHGMIVTSAKGFTRAAREEIRRVTENTNMFFESYRLDLLAFPEVVDLLRLRKREEEYDWSRFIETFHSLPGRETILDLPNHLRPWYHPDEQSLEVGEYAFERRRDSQ